MKKQDLTRTIIRGPMTLSVVILVMILALVAVPALAAKPQVTDMSITDAVEDELVWDSAVPALLIDVMTTDGIVTLSGSVDNILAKERAARIAETVKGVRAVVDEIHVNSPLQRTDRQIREDVEQALLIDPATDFYEVNVQVKENVVTLSGKVESWQEKNLCEIVAKGVKGVEGVIMIDNNLGVQQDYHPYICDPYVDDSYLCDSDWCYYRPSLVSKSDRQIKAYIEKELFWSPFVDADDVKVDVEKGVVTLTGTVDSWSESNAAVNNAYEGGAVYVDNELNVK